MRVLAITLTLMASAASAETWTEMCNVNEQIGTCSASVTFDEASGVYTLTTGASGCISADVQVDSSIYPHKFVGMTTQGHVTRFDKTKKVSVKPVGCRIYAPLKAENDSVGGGDHASGKPSGEDPMAGHWAGAGPNGTWTLELRNGVINADGTPGTYSGTNGFIDAPVLTCRLTLEAVDTIGMVCDPKPGVDGAPVRPIIVTYHRQ